MNIVSKKPTIAIDVDGVLRDNLGIMVDLYNNSVGANLSTSDIKEFKTELSFPLIQEKLGVNPSDFFFRDHAKEIFLDAPAYPNIQEDIEFLKHNADVIIVTYQKGYTNKLYTLQWLEKNGVDPNGICFLRDKTLVHCDALIDDNDWNFIGTHVGTSVLVTQPYNERLSLEEHIKCTNSKKMVRVDSLHDFTLKFLNRTITL